MEPLDQQAHKEAQVFKEVPALQVLLDQQVLKVLQVYLVVLVPRASQEVQEPLVVLV